MEQQKTENLFLLRRRDVMAKTGLKQTSLYNKIATGDFPKPIKIGERQCAWESSAVDAWILSKIQKGQN